MPTEAFPELGDRESCRYCHSVITQCNCATQYHTVLYSKNHCTEYHRVPTTVSHSKNVPQCKVPAFRGFQPAAEREGHSMLTHREIRVTDRVSYDYVRITFSVQEIFYILDMFGFFLENVYVFSDAHCQSKEHV